MKQQLLKLMGLGDPSHPIVLAYRRRRRKMGRLDRRIRDNYFHSGADPKLHLGASNHLLPGWLNTDLCPDDNVMQLDATEVYPFEDSVFSFVYCEHMIEHVPFDCGLRMLEQCRRVLKPGGILRVVTPNLATIMSLYGDKQASRKDEYVDWMATTFTPDAPENSPAFVINAFFRLWGHQFIYDVETLTNSMVAAGFREIQVCRLFDSSHEALSSLANADRYPDGLLEFESICLEARK